MVRRYRQWLNIPHGAQVRRCVAFLGILMGMGRLFDYGTSTVLIFGASKWLGGLLTCGALALGLTASRRLTISGRIAASLAVFCFATLGGATLGNNASNMYFFCALICFAEAISRHDDDC